MDEQLTGTATSARRVQHKAPWELPTPMQIAAFVGGPANGLVTLLPFGEREIVIMPPGQTYGIGRYVRGPHRRSDGAPVVTLDGHHAWEWVE